MATQDQQHPQEKTDRQIINRLLTGDPTDENLLDLARLRIRYRNFPGARDIQRDLNLTMKRWELTEEEIFTKTREIYQARKLSKQIKGDDDQDWS